MEENEDTCRQMMDTNPASAGNNDSQCYDGTLPKDGLKDGSMESKGTEDGTPKATFGCQHYKRKCKLFVSEVDIKLLPILMVLHGLEI